MRPPTRSRAVIPLLVAVVAGCSLGEPATRPPTPKVRYTNPPPTPTFSAIATVSPTGHGRPYTPQEIATQFEDWIATHPVSIDRTLQAPTVVKAIANVLADDIYTFDGQPYQEVFFGGRCGEPPVLCTLQMVGVPRFAADRDASDAYHWEVHPQTPLVVMTDVGLGGYPGDLADSLDTLARSLDTEGKIGDRTLQSVQWSIPPPDDAFLLRYSRGLEEEDPSLYVRLDRAAGRILSIGAQP